MNEYTQATGMITSKNTNKSFKCREIDSQTLKKKNHQIYKQTDCPSDQTHKNVVIFVKITLTVLS